MLTLACTIADTLACSSQDLAATMPDPREFWRCGPEDPTTEFEEVLEFQVGLHQFSAISLASKWKTKGSFPVFHAAGHTASLLTDCQ